MPINRLYVPKIKKNVTVYSTNTLDATGELTFTANTVSGFSDSNYLTPSQDYLALCTTSFEMVWVISLTETPSNNSGLYDTNNDKIAPNIRLTISDTRTVTLRLRTATGNDTYTFNIFGATVIPLNTKYYIKVNYDSTNGYSLYVSSDGINYTLEGSNSSITKVEAGNAIRIGDNFATGYYLTGNIYLNECYIKVDDNIVWQGGIQSNIVPKNFSYTPLIKSRRKRYYKNYRINNVFTPTLTANGTMGGDTWACQADSEYNTTYVAYNVFRSSSYWRSASAVSGHYLAWYSPTAYGLDGLTITNYSNSNGRPTSYDIQVSDDGTTWTTVKTGTSNAGVSTSWDIDLTDVTNLSKYWRFYINSVVSGNYVYLSKINFINGYTIVPLEVSANDDYDFMTNNEENTKYIISKIIDTEE